MKVIQFFSTSQLVEITQALGCDKPTSGSRACLDEKYNIHTKKKKQPTDSCIMASILRQPKSEGKFPSSSSFLAFFFLVWLTFGEPKFSSALTA